MIDGLTGQANGRHLRPRLLASVPRNAAEPPLAATSLSGRILLAEDGEDNQQLIAFHLRKAGAEVEIADNGRIALERLEAAAAEGLPFALLLTDMQMPEMDGYTLARTLRAGGERIPIVALTAHAMAEDRQKCLDAGCDDYASKPINKSALLATCRKWMERGRAATPGAEPEPSASQAAAARLAETTALVSELADDPDMAGLVDKFLAGLGPKAALVAEQHARHRLGELARLAHQLKGAGGGYGFPAISEAAKKVELQATTDPDLRQLALAVDELTRLCAQAIAGRTPQDGAGATEPAEASPAMEIESSGIQSQPPLRGIGFCSSTTIWTSTSSLPPCSGRKTSSCFRPAAAAMPWTLPGGSRPI